MATPSDTLATAAPRPVEAAAKLSKPDLATIGGVVLALCGILGGLILEKGVLADVTRPTAALIVLGGTIGAVLVATPLTTFLQALKRLEMVIFEKSREPRALIEEIIAQATKARRNGLVSLEDEVERASDPFLRKALTLAIDGADIAEIRKMLELDISLGEHHAEAEAKVFESAGGFAPTIGIMGAVMGLLQVMKNLGNMEEVGAGIGTAFVATLYGVGVANLFFLPFANKIKSRAQHEAQMKELVVEGVVAIIEGLNPKLIRLKLEAFVHSAAKEPPKK